MKNFIYLINYLFFLTIYLFSVSVFAIQDIQVDITDQNFNSSNKIVINEDQIKNSHAESVAQLLSSQANISVSSTSFQPNSIYLRGGDSSHVLILIDGVPSYDPSTVQRTVNLSSLNLKNIKKIEIIKGSQSVIYGGQALSGVISIETFPTQQIKNESEITVQGGLNDGGISVSHLEALTSEFAVSSSARFEKINNRSPVLGSAKTYPQQLGSLDTSVLYTPTANDKAILHLNYSDDRSQIATSDFVTFMAADTENFVSSTEGYGSTFVYNRKDFFQFSLAYQSTRRLFLQSAADAIVGGATDQDYRGTLFSANFNIQVLNTETNKILLGYGHTQELMKSLDTNVVQADSQNQSEGLFVKGSHLLGDELLFEAGARHQMSKLNTLDDTYQVGLSWHREIKLEYSTGFKSPSLFQLYSAYGNQNLQPEKAKSTSLSYEKKINDQLFFSIMAFDAQFDNLIVIKGSPQHYENVSSTRTVGTEVLTSFQNRSFNSNFRTDYTLALGYQEPKDLTTNDWLIRRPLRTASFKISQNFSEALVASAEINHTGSRRDRGAAGSYLTIEDFTLLNLISNYQATENISAFARIDNVTDQKYQTAFGFYTQGIIAKIGAQINF